MNNTFIFRKFPDHTINKHLLWCIEIVRSIRKNDSVIRVYHSSPFQVTISDKIKYPPASRTIAVNFPNVMNANIPFIPLSFEHMGLSANYMMLFYQQDPSANF